MGPLHPDNSVSVYLKLCSKPSGPTSISTSKKMSLIALAHPNPHLILFFFFFHLILNSYKHYYLKHIISSQNGVRHFVAVSVYDFILPTSVSSRKLGIGG